MIALGFTFPAGRYHATPWGRHANEADVAWPPEPVRILRALIATWWRKADRTQFSSEALGDLVDALAADPPVFRLPDAVHSHIRAYMPAPAEKKLIYDAFLRLDASAELIVGWPSVILTTEQRAFAAHLLERIGYLGRAESWTLGRIADEWDGDFNAAPRHHEPAIEGTSVPTDITIPLPPPEWANLRRRLMSGVDAKKAKGTAIVATLPERLADAIAIDTGDWQRFGWSSPPPLRRIVYDRPPLEPFPAFTRRQVPLPAQRSDMPEVARFVLAGRPQPRIEDALRIGEIARFALMSGGGAPPPEFSGRIGNAPRRDDPGHAHAFFLPEDADGDGLIDHLIVYCRHGFSAESRNRLDRLSRLWVGHGRPDEDGERGRREWRVALEDIAAPGAFADVSALLRPSSRWESVTPYLMPWHAKRNFGVAEQLAREVERRGTLPVLRNVEVPAQRQIMRRSARFQRIRSRPGLVQPDTCGAFVMLTFAEPVVGPLAFGFACHYGLGLFTAARRRIEDMQR